jgi:hypothetical protein
VFKYAARNRLRFCRAFSYNPFDFQRSGKDAALRHGRFASARQALVFPAASWLCALE